MVSILLRYKRSTGSRGSSSSKYKKSSRRFVPGTAVRLLGAKNRKTIRPLRSRVPTICHNIFDDYVMWTRTKSGGYVKSRGKSLEVNFCEKYTLGEKLGSGGFGTVWAGVRNSNDNGAKARRIRRREKFFLALNGFGCFWILCFCHFLPPSNSHWSGGDQAGGKVTCDSI